VGLPWFAPNRIAHGSAKSHGFTRQEKGGDEEFFEDEDRVSINGPQNGWLIMEDPSQMDNLGVHPILETPYLDHGFLMMFT